MLHIHSKCSSLSSRCLSTHSQWPQKVEDFSVDNCNQMSGQSRFLSIACTVQQWWKTCSFKKKKTTTVWFTILSWYSLLFQCNTIHHANFYKKMHFFRGIYPLSDSQLMIYNLLKSLVYLGFDGNKSCMFTEKGNHERRILNCHLLSSGKVQNLIQRRETKHILKPGILCLPTTLICITHKLHRSPSNVQLQEQSLFWP